MRVNACKAYIPNAHGVQYFASICILASHIVFMLHIQLRLQDCTQHTLQDACWSIRRWTFRSTRNDYRVEKDIKVQTRSASHSICVTLDLSINVQ